MPLLVYPNLELTPFTINNTTEVNPWPMDDVQVQLVNGDLMIYMRGRVSPTGQLPGALVGFKVPVVSSVNGMPALYGGLNHEMKVDEVSNSLLQAWECDLKWCVQAALNPATPIPNVVDGSVQKVYPTGGMWQIDDKMASWKDTGVKTGKFTPNQFTRVATRMSRTSSGLFTMTGVADGAGSNTFPASYNGVQFQNLPLLNTNWTASGVQIQMCLAKTGFLVAWLRNVSALFSDVPIPASL